MRNLNFTSQFLIEIQGKYILIQNTLYIWNLLIRMNLRTIKFTQNYLETSVYKSTRACISFSTAALLGNLFKEPTNNHFSREDSWSSRGLIFFFFFFFLEELKTLLESIFFYWRKYWHSFFNIFHDKSLWKRIFCMYIYK